MWLVSVTSSQVWMLSFSLSHTGHCKFNKAPRGKELSWGSEKKIVSLHKDGVDYKKITKTLKLSCSTVAKTIQWFNRTGSTQNRPRQAVVGLMDRALDLKPEVTQGCGFESRLWQEVHDCSPGAAQSAAHCSKCVHLDGLNAENTFHSSLYSV